MANGHFAGRLDSAITETIGKATGRQGSFYSILNKYGFYDIDDESNGLTAIQKARVPEINKKRMSNLCSAIAEMIKYVSNAFFISKRSLRVVSGESDLSI